jgi:hypothetical protein
VHVEPLDGETDLARVLERAFENAGRDLLRIDVVEHDAGVVAAQFQRNAFQRGRRIRHHLLTGCGRSSERDLADVGMFRHLVAEIVGVGNDVQDALGQDVLDQLGKFQRRQRGGRCRLYHQRIAGQKRRRQFEAEDQQRIVPGDDGPDDAERAPMRLDAAITAVLYHTHRQVERTEIAEEAGHAHDLAGGIRQRLALLAGQKARQFIGVGFDGVGHFGDELAAFRHRVRRPGGKSRLCRGDGGVELALGSARALRKHFFGRRIEDRHGLVSGYHVPVDEKLEITHGFALSLCTDLFPRSRYVQLYITTADGRPPGPMAVRITLIPAGRRRRDNDIFFRI